MTRIPAPLPLLAPLAKSDSKVVEMTASSERETITVYDIRDPRYEFEPTAIWSHADSRSYSPYTKALRLLRADRATSPQEHVVIQALLEQDEHGHWTGLPSEDMVDFAGPLTSENLTRCLHMHAHATFERRDVIASCLVVLHLMDLGLAVHIHPDWAKLLVKQVLLAVLDVVKQRGATWQLDDEVNAHVNHIRVWSEMPRGFDAWADKAAARMALDPYSVLPRRAMIQYLSQRSPRTTDTIPNLYVRQSHILGYLTNLISIS